MKLILLIYMYKLFFTYLEIEHTKLYIHSFSSPRAKTIYINNV